MTSYLLIYDRRRGRILREAEFADSGEALRERFRVEKEYKGDRGIEVVVLNAASREDLYLTHSRYFSSVGDLARRIP